MAQEIKDLIAQIQKEGVQQAQAQAQQIQIQSRRDAEKIILGAQAEAAKIIEQANIQAAKLSDSTQSALKQASRDLLISLKEEIISMLERLIKTRLQEALSPEELAQIIGALIKNAPLSLGSQIEVSLNQKDKDRLEQGLLKQLVETAKQGIVLKSAVGISSGFVISFDGGKSIFDFSAQALSDYILGSLHPELNKILNP